MKTDFIIDCTEISQADLLSVDPVVSVLMITYNHERFLGEAIEGVVKQVTDFPIELIIGEDCSTDNTRQVALNYQKQYPNLIRVLYSERNIGPNKNIARVLSHCRGQFIAICEGDDYWVDTSKLEKEVRFFLNNPEYVVTYHRNIVVDSDGLVIKNTEENSKTWHDYSRGELIMAAYMQTLTMCFRNIIDELPPEFFNVLNADRFLRSILGQYGCAKYLHEIKPSVYRIHDGGIWSGISKLKQKSELINTLFWMSIYYKRVGNIHISNRYSLMALDNLMSSLDFNYVSKTKYFLKQIFPKLYSILRKIKNIKIKID